MEIMEIWVLCAPTTAIKTHLLKQTFLLKIGSKGSFIESSLKKEKTPVSLYERTH